MGMPVLKKSLVCTTVVGEEPGVSRSDLLSQSGHGYLRRQRATCCADADNGMRLLVMLHDQYLAYSVVL